MNKQDSEAFDKWFKERYRYSYKDLVIPESVNPQKEAWKAALEHEREQSSKLMDAMTKTSQYNSKLREELNEWKEAARSEAQMLNEERERSKMLVEFIKTLDNSSYDNYSEEALEVLEKYKGEK